MSSEIIPAYRRQVEELAREKKNFRISNRQLSHASVLIEEIFNHAQRDVRLFCGSLRPDFYQRPELKIAIDEFLRKEGSHLFILTEQNIGASHPVVEYLTRQYHSKVELRWKSFSTNFNRHFAVMDRLGFRFEFSHAENGDVEAVANFNEPETADKLATHFDDMFVRAENIS